MVKAIILKATLNIDDTLKTIRERLETYRYDKVVEIKRKIGRDIADKKLSPIALAQFKDDCKEKYRMTRRSEIPPLLNEKNEITYATFMITFGTRGPAFKDRAAYKQYGKDTSSFGIAHRLAALWDHQFLLGPDSFGFNEAYKRRPKAKNGYQGLAYLGKKWNEKQETNRIFGKYSPRSTIGMRFKPLSKDSPFGVTGSRFGKSTIDPDIPGPGLYRPENTKIGQRIRAQHKFGHGATLPPPFHMYCSNKKDEKCHMCQREVWFLPSFYALPGKKLFLCSLCYLVERKMAITLRPGIVAKLKRVVDCKAIHTHFVDADHILTHASLKEINWLARKELYMHLYFPKQRDSIPQKGVRRYAAP